MVGLLGLSRKSEQQQKTSQKRNVTGLHENCRGLMIREIRVFVDPGKHHVRFFEKISALGKRIGKTAKLPYEVAVYL